MQGAPPGHTALCFSSTLQADILFLLCLLKASHFFYSQVCVSVCVRHRERNGEIHTPSYIPYSHTVGGGHSFERWCYEVCLCMQCKCWGLLRSERQTFPPSIRVSFSLSGNETKESEMLKGEKRKGVGYKLSGELKFKIKLTLINCACVHVCMCLYETFIRI